MRVLILVCVAVFSRAGFGLDQAAGARYLEDFDFIKKTAARSSAALVRHKIDWKAACARLRPAFAACKDDTAHVRNVMQLLACLRDSHTGVWRHFIKSGLPSKWDGLYGGGLWFGWEEGRFTLRGIMAGHAIGSSIPPGSTLVGIDGKPAWLVMAQERERITTFRGSSSDHSLFSSMGNRLLPFGEKQYLGLTFLKPDLKSTTVQVRRWGPGGKAFYPWTVQFPEGLKWKKGAVATMLSLPWCKKVGWIRITGSMDRETSGAFHRALDGLEGMEVLLLDCRGMGGGGDGPAWDIAGRFFRKAVPNGRGRQIRPTGSWQFVGPVVMLQDETEISSAETFTWAMSETERVVSVGRNTGGWGIIPTIFKCPSGILDFRMGVTDRPTPIKGVRTEGVGWPPDIRIPHGPVFCAAADPAQDAGREVLRLLHAGIGQEVVVAAFTRLFLGDVDGFKKQAARFAKKVKGWKGDAIARRFRDDLKNTLEMETAALLAPKGPPPDTLGAARRHDDLVARAKKARLNKNAASLKKALKARKAERAAQDALLKLLAGEDAEDPKKRAAYLRKYGKTRLGKWVRTQLWM